MKVEKISLRKRAGLELHRQYRKISAQQHTLNYLLWECTLRCNLSCRHCGSDCRKEAGQKDMPLKDFLKVVDTIRPHVNPHETMIVLTGGEALLHPEIEQCGRELYRREFPWGLVSNGMAFTKEKFDRLLLAGLHSVTISLDGLEDSHNRMRGNPGSFKKAVQAIRYLVANEDEVVFDVVSCITRNTFPELSRLKEMLLDMGVKKWRVFTVFPIGRAKDEEDLQLTPVQFKALFDFIRETRKENRIRLSYGCEGFLGAYESEVRENFFFCRAGVTAASVLVDGSISACPNLRSNFIQGNIYRDDFWEVWNTCYQPHRDRSWTRKGECAECSHYRYCEGNGLHLRDEEGNLLFCHLHRIAEGEKGVK